MKLKKVIVSQEGNFENLFVEASEGDVQLGNYSMESYS
jgi:hypothetical protein